ncbi:ABC transporter ATP-binding protein [Rhodobacteraceae bacterium CCMM004]|nr:ABC transporter ATP-binding protein [Rhodobacteraceae bacterium CCMM004]
MTAALEVRDLRVRFDTDTGPLDAVRGVSFSIAKGELLALVGESGSGKSVTALSIPQLLPPVRVSHPGGSIRVGGDEMIGASESVLRGVRGGRVGMIFQEPMTSLNPLQTIERQIGETLRLHQGLSGRALRDRVVELLDLVRLDAPRERLDSYPHQLSGGQRQRVMIAIAVANDPDLLIADEPTTALDVTIQAQILELVRDLRTRLGMAVLLITHDLTIVRRIADRVCVMHNGEIVEEGETAALFADPQHSYTRHLLASEPAGRPPARDPGAPMVIEASDVAVHFPIRKGILRRQVGAIKAVDGVSIAIRKGQTVGVVGESGSGKSTLGLALLRLRDSRGRIAFLGRPLNDLPPRDIHALRRQMQIVFQDPYSSLSPRMTVRQIVSEGLDIHGIGRPGDERRARVAELLHEVRLDPAMMDRYPHEFSGGQRQRISIARVLALKPDFVVLDEPTSALDLSIQAQIVELLRELQARHGLSYMFISHDLRVVRALCDEVIVMRKGTVVEQGSAAAIFEDAQHPYTRALIGASFDIVPSPPPNGDGRGATA